ncbi:hypothetical protein [Mesorhizobium sp. B2-8-3]|uniref:hypothetical protein n=1 Tax=Mesorhizobium sp. B2-8-3 TaxID=2589905 RepID=UPI001128D7C6|nr:hypothetical protein [Mesorhizobium sp. B2-8-3]TPJ34434.1 hypothetical protein FJ418_10350 [Mesorhizobium sp. B2-8-3]
MDNYKIVFFGRRGRAVGQRIVPREGHWEACEWAWKHKPSGTVDFHVEEATFESESVEQTRKDDEIIQMAFHILRKRAGMIDLP